MLRDIVERGPIGRRVAAVAVALTALVLPTTLGAPPARAALLDGGTLTSGTPVTAPLTTAGDDLGWTFTAAAGEHVTVDVTAASWTSPSGPAAATLRYLDPSGTQVRECAITTPTWCELTAATEGTFTVVVDPDGDTTGSLTFTFARDQAPRALTPSVAVTSVVTVRGQNASYTVTTAVGQQVNLNVSSTIWRIGGTSPGTANLELIAPDGTVQGTCPVSSGIAICIFNPSQTGIWSLRLDPQGAATGSITFAGTGFVGPTTPVTEVIAPVVARTGLVPKKLTFSFLRDLYTRNGVAGTSACSNLVPLLPARGSAVRTLFAAALGVADYDFSGTGPTGTIQPPPGIQTWGSCVTGGAANPRGLGTGSGNGQPGDRKGGPGGAAIVQNDGRVVDGGNQVLPHAITAWIQQASQATSDLRGGTSLVSLDFEAITYVVTTSLLRHPLALNGDGAIPAGYRGTRGDLTVSA